jgi:hypothetical protein
MNGRPAAAILVIVECEEPNSQGVNQFPHILSEVENHKGTRTRKRSKK